MSKQLSFAIAALVAFATAATTAEAKGGHHHGHRHHHGRVFLYVTSTGPSCGYYYAKWQSTGAFYWKKQYYACKGWW